ncbi:MAG: glycosyltransferase [Gammaproteobacteria bacterium]
MSFSGDGGVERMMVNLMTGFISKGFSIDLILAKAQGSFLEKIPPEVNIIKLGRSHTLTCLPGLIRYLKKNKPEALFVAKHRAGIVALLAKKCTGLSTRIVLRLGTTVSAALLHKNRFRRWQWYNSMQRAYPKIDTIIAVSKGVANDVSQITGIPVSQIKVIHNPVITPQLHELAAESVDHPWLQTDEIPVIIGMGRMTQQKDFSSLVRAFANVRKKIACRLILLGGGDQTAIRELADELGVKEHISLPGFQKNPYAYLTKANLFVLSSRWEGSPNALTEAMAVGIPVVSTDCPSGPREIMQDGKYGPLCPVGDIDCLAAAIEATLKKSPERFFIQSAVESYTIENSTEEYLKVIIA